MSTTPEPHPSLILKTLQDYAVILQPIGPIMTSLAYTFGLCFIYTSVTAISFFQKSSLLETLADASDKPPAVKLYRTRAKSARDHGAAFCLLALVSLVIGFYGATHLT